MPTQMSPQPQLDVDAVVAFSTMFWGIFCLVMWVGLVVGAAIGVVISILLYQCFTRIPAEHQKMSPGMVFLLLIPLFSLIWNFFVYQRLPESYQSYFAAQGRTDVGDCGKQLGLWYAICAACSLVPCVNSFAGIAGLVLLIMFLVKAFELRRQIPAPTS